MSAKRQTLSYLVDYMIWADQELLSACSKLSPEELNRDLGDSHAGILGTLRHMFIAEYDWLARLRESLTTPLVEVRRDLLFPDSHPGPDLPQLLELWPRVWEGFRHFMATLPELDLDEEFAAMGEHIQRWKLLLHVVNHATLHRGQAVGMLRQLGHQPPSTDLFTYHWMIP
ncbi:MAG TPA: DinB family protein [Terracidiphilus sp.]|jgi:uncharacterized damage-inducible protein DinB|nr:DinB family protein [Terracidiphilus sp.]